MFTGSIKISELDNLGIVLTQDFFPLVESSSLTTFRVSIQTLNGWFSVSGSCLTASWASRSFSMFLRRGHLAQFIQYMEFRHLSHLHQFRRHSPHSPYDL